MNDTKTFKPLTKEMEEAHKAVRETLTAVFGYHKNRQKPAVPRWVPSVSVELERDHDSDMIVIDGWIYLAETDEHEETYVSLGAEGKQTRKVKGWYLSYGWEDPGVRYYPDGSGQPPSWEVADCNPPTYRNLFSAIEAICNMIVKNVVQNMGESAYWEKEAQDRKDGKFEEGY